MNEDLDSARRLRSGDEEAWRKFIRDYRNPCYILAKRYRCHNHFEEFFSDLIFVLWKSDLAGYRGEKPLEELIMRRFSNIVSTYMHKAKRRSTTLIYEEHAAEPSASLLAEKEETYELMAKARSELRGDEKRILEEYYFKDLTLDEMAAKRGVHASTIMRRLKKTLAKLKARIEGP
ncbi:sigma-70 family RNA polymerase sigma factor [bacterium]|nr:sigma-70 family RNA polymerase sigma factor [bacterium]